MSTDIPEKNAAGLKTFVTAHCNECGTSRTSEAVIAAEVLNERARHEAIGSASGAQRYVRNGAPSYVSYVSKVPKERKMKQCHQDCSM